MDEQAQARSYSLGLILPSFCAAVAVLVVASPGLVPDSGRVLLNVGAIGAAALVGAALTRVLPALRPWLVPLGGGALLISTYLALAGVLPWVIPEAREWQLLQLDRAWFGYYWERAWGGVQHALLTDLLQVVYACFYVFPFAFGLGLALRKDWNGFYSGVDRIILGFILSYCGYLVVPARSPYEFIEYASALPSFGMRDAVQDNLIAVSKTRHDCFPSGHTMMSSYVAWLSWTRGRFLFWLLGPWSVLTIVATLYLRYHYFIDILAGLAATALLIPVSNWIFGSFRRSDSLESRP